MKTLSALIVLWMLSSVGCATQRVLADPNTVHQLARDAEVVIYVRHPDGHLVEQEAIARAGTFLVPEHIVKKP